MTFTLFCTKFYFLFFLLQSPLKFYVDSRTTIKSFKLIFLHVFLAIVETYTMSSTHFYFLFFVKLLELFVLRLMRLRFRDFKCSNFLKCFKQEKPIMFMSFQNRISYDQASRRKLFKHFKGKQTRQ